MTELPLAGLCIWLTRPARQSAGLEASLHGLGASTFCLPLLDIRFVPPQGAALDSIRQLDRYDLVFYVSTNAARAGLEAIDDWWPQYPAGIVNVAVGPATAAVLEARGLEVHYPEERMDSEAALAMPALQDVAGKRALIVRGKGGREILSSGLRRRGASVDYCELYERGLPDHDPEWLRANLLAHPPSAIVISSGEAMDNLKALFEPWYEAWQELPLYVVSERLHEHARKAGFRHVVTMAGATDAAIIRGLLAVAWGRA
jgi:uroporphyrinogen-III synthase